MTRIKTEPWALSKSMIISRSRPPFKTYKVDIVSSPTQFRALISTKLSSPSTKSKNKDYPIWSSTECFAGQKIKHTSNVNRFIDSFVVLRNNKNTRADSTCSFHYNIQKYIGFTQCNTETIYLQFFLSISPPLQPNINNIHTPSKCSQRSIGNIFI